jgi:pimeloyl-ACP methyl ester carboxylesterase
MDDVDLMEPGWSSRRIAVNGVMLHVVAAGTPTGRPIILLHGFPEFWWGWREVITPLADAGYRVIVPDMRGYNLSDAPRDVGAYGIDTLAADVTGLADALGIGRFLLVGHDWGGVVAWWVAARHGDRVERLVILDAPHPKIRTRRARKRLTQALRSSYILFFQLRRAPEMVFGAFRFAGLRAMMRRSARAGAFEPGLLMRYARAWQRPGRFTAMLNYYRALGQPRSRGPARVSAPTLILWGARDSFLEPHVAEASLEQCDDGRLEILPQATHWLHLEQPSRIVALTRAHLEASG